MYHEKEIFIAVATDSCFKLPVPPFMVSRKQTPQLLSTSISFFSLLSIPPIWTVLPRCTHRPKCPGWSRSSWISRRPHRARQATNQIGRVDSDVASFLGWGIHGLAEDHHEQTGHHTHMEHCGHWGVTKGLRKMSFKTDYSVQFIKHANLGSSNELRLHSVIL